MRLMFSDKELQYLKEHADEANPGVWIPKLIEEIERLNRILTDELDYRPDC